MNFTIIDWKNILSELLVNYILFSLVAYNDHVCKSEMNSFVSEKSLL